MMSKDVQRRSAAVDSVEGALQRAEGTFRSVRMHDDCDTNAVTGSVHWQPVKSLWISAMTLTALIAGLADGSIAVDTGCDWNSARQQLLALPGLGPWTAEVIAMRGLGDPDAFPAGDLGLRLAAEQLGLPIDQRTLTELSAGWRPWRSYAVQHLWTTLVHPVNQWPPQEVA